MPHRQQQYIVLSLNCSLLSETQEFKLNIRQQPLVLLAEGARECRVLTVLRVRAGAAGSIRTISTDQCSSQQKKIN